MTDREVVDDLFLDRLTTGHVGFGGLGGDVARVTITREAWKELGEPRVLRVRAAATVGEEGEDL